MQSSWEPSRIRRAVAVTVPAAVMLVLGLWGLDRGGIWRDEAVTFQVARRSVPQIWRLLHSVDAVHGLYYLLMHAVLAVRAGEVPLRLPSVCAAAVTAGLIAALGTRLARPRVGLWAGLLYAVTPMADHYAQEGRSYALVAAGATGATLLLVRAVSGGGRSWWPYGVLVGVTCWLHEFAVLLLLAHAMTLALARTPWPVWRGWAVAAGTAALTLVPLVLVSRTQSAQLAWVREPDPATAEWLVREFLGQSDPVYRICLVLAVLGAAGVLGRRGEPTAAGVALPLLLVPPAVLMTASLATPLYVDRYVLYALAGAPLLTALGADRLTRLPYRRSPRDSPRADSRVVPGLRPPARPRSLVRPPLPPPVTVPGARGARRPIRITVPWPERRFPRSRSRAVPDRRPPTGPARAPEMSPGAPSVVSGLGVRRVKGLVGAAGRRLRHCLPRTRSRVVPDRRSPAPPPRLPGVLPPVTVLGPLRTERPVRSTGSDGSDGSADRWPRRPPRDPAPRFPGGPAGPRPRRPGVPANSPPGPRPGPPAPRRSGTVRSRVVAAAGVLAVGAVLVVQLPVLRADRLAATRPDDLALVAALAGRELRPGDPVLFLPSHARGTALAYPAGFRGTRDVALAGPAAGSGTLYGRETGERTLRRRLAGLRQVWVVAERRVLDAPGYPGDPAERAKLTVVEEQFTLREESVRGAVALRLYTRRPPIRTPASPAAPPRPAPW
ncbi:glycosyltransferase family 39 protein [Streptomyces sp. NPDC047000]|uniref:glycosyltransferase family 39 protein n=1 Tax=Streptomyces sp. NPDC047000 TaxID=3155474 RepID=UPI0033E2C0E6